MLQASSEGLGRGLDAVATATVIIELLQQHHLKVIQPHVDSSPSESNACSTGLATLIRSVEERVLASMQAILSAFFAQVHSRCMSSAHAVDRYGCKCASMSGLHGYLFMHK